MAPKQIRQTTNIEVLKELMKQAKVLSTGTIYTNKDILENLVYLTAKRGFDGFQDEGK